MRYIRNYTDRFNAVAKTEDILADYEEKGRYFSLTKETVDVYFQNAQAHHKRACDEFTDEKLITQKLELCVKYSLGLNFRTFLKTDASPQTFAEKLKLKRRNLHVAEILLEYQTKLSKFDLFSKSKPHGPKFWCLEWANKVLKSSHSSYETLFDELSVTGQECLSYFVAEAEKFLFTTAKGNIDVMVERHEAEFQTNEKLIILALEKDESPVFVKKDVQLYLQAELRRIKVAKKALLREHGRIQDLIKDFEVMIETKPVKISALKAIPN